ncbi:AAA family ATPase [Desulfoscipio sp. XC116]|uniref:helix-turn-helix transcriptional regulator n=1 Tax=Desulfoscipio sp. XC116 TaxID=3144975 RepID=UPI00325B4E09
MFTLPNYVITEEIHENNRIKVYRGHAVWDRSPVIIKAIKTGMADPVNISKLIYEYEISRSLDIEGIVKPARLEQNGATLALIMEDTGAISLREYLADNRPDLSGFFSISVQLVKILGELHQQGVIHRDLKPDNILIHPANEEVKIIDFSIAALIPAESENASFSAIPIGTPAYMSPEQTGRVNRTTDCRSDFYSLGVVFYELLTGRLPLLAENPAQWVYVHTAQNPLPLSEINPEVPPAVSAIIMKMLSKSAEKRYQSDYGLLWDLEECRRQWNKNGIINPFPPGKADIAGRFQLPQKLCGREKETAALTDAFGDVCSGQAGLVMVSGYAGTGKTVLVNETLKPLAAGRAWFITGKSDQLRHNVPYSPFIQAFGNLMRQLLTESKENLAAWKKRLLRALSGSVSVIAGVIPEVELITGPRPAAPPLQPVEAQNRFCMAFRNFVRVFAKRKHPLVIFLDDLQWADPASLQLIRFLSDGSDSRCLLIIGAYRDNDAAGTQPLLEILGELQKADIPVRHIALAPLDPTHTGQFIADSLGCSEEKAAPLAAILYRKTGGNPFFLVQLLRSLYKENHVAFNREKGCWEWDTESLRAIPIADDIINFMLARLHTLPRETRHILMSAACIGNAFDLPTLAIACEKNPAAAVETLLPAVLEGLVLKVSCPGHEYEFLHDRVQQAAYSLIPGEQKKELRLKIGRLILERIGRDELDGKIFSVMDLMNCGPNLIGDPAERIKLAGYNLAAGRKAKASAACAAALNYFRAGAELLPEDAWDKHYQLTYDLYIERSQCEYLCADSGTAERLFDIILARAKTELERADVYGKKIQFYSTTRQYDAAVQLGVKALRELGVGLPPSPGKIHFIKELITFKWYMRGKKTEELASLPEMSDPLRRKMLELIILIADAADLSNPDLYGLILLKIGNFTIKHGHTDLSPIGYAGCGIAAGSILGNHAAGHEFEKVCLQLAEKYDNSSYKCIVYFLLGSFVAHWTQHGKTGIDYLCDSVRYGRESGQVLYAGYALAVLIENKYLLGIPLGEVAEEVKNCYNFAKRMKHDNLFINAIIYRRLVSAIMGLSGDPFTFSAGVYDESSLDENGLMELMKDDNPSLLTYYITEMQLCYLLGDYAKSLALAEKAQKNIDAIMGFRNLAEYNFYYSLAIVAVYDRLSPGKKRKYRKILKKNQRQMKRWSDFCSENFLHKYLLVAAEISRLSGGSQKTMDLYDRAMQSARENGYIQIEALSNELAAEYYLAEGREKIARAYMVDACRGYWRWGAMAKVRALRERFPHLLAGIAPEERKYDPAKVLKSALRISSTASDSVGDLDLHAIRVELKKLSEETDPKALLKSFLEITVKNAGADKGYVLLEKDGELFIEALKESGRPAEVIVPVYLEKNNNLPISVVRYVARTLEPVVLNGGDQAGVFAGDPYIAQSRTKSIVCLPVLFWGMHVGVLYLENSLMAGVFIPDRLEVLKLLSTQMAYVKNMQPFIEGDSTGIKDEMPGAPVVSLTERELEVLELIALGMSNKEIAHRLQLTVSTVKTHILNIYGKLQVNRRVQAVIRARELKLLQE